MISPSLQLLYELGLLFFTSSSVMAHLYVPYSACSQKVVSLYLFNDCPCFLLPIKPLLQGKSRTNCSFAHFIQATDKTTAHLVAEAYWKLPFLLMQPVYLITWPCWPEGSKGCWNSDCLWLGRRRPCLQYLVYCSIGNWIFKSTDLQWVWSRWESWLVLGIIKKQRNDLDSWAAFWCVRKSITICIPLNQRKACGLWNLSYVQSNLAAWTAKELLHSFIHAFIHWLVHQEILG